MKNLPFFFNPSVRTSDITIWIIAVRFIKKIPEGQEKCEEGNLKCNIENVLKEHSIHSNEINIWNVNSKYHTTKDHTKRHIKLYGTRIKSLKLSRQPHHIIIYPVINHS